MRIDSTKNKKDKKKKKQQQSVLEAEFFSIM